MGVIEELNEILGKDVLTRAFAQALEAQGTSPRMGVGEIEQRLERGEDVYIDADWYLTERNLIDLVPQIVVVPSRAMGSPTPSQGNLQISASITSQASSREFSE